jgi:hypothetical protein
MANIRWPGRIAAGHSPTSGRLGTGSASGNEVAARLGLMPSPFLIDRRGIIRSVEFDPD